MKLEEVSARCKIMSKPELLFIIKCLIKNKMMTSGQIVKEYGKSIPDSRFTELLALKVVSVSRYGIFSLDKGVDDFSFIISELNLSEKQREKLPSIINYTPVMGFFITEETDKVFVLHNPEGKVLSKHLAEYKAIAAQVSAVKRRRQSIINKRNNKARYKKDLLNKKRLDMITKKNSLNEEDLEWLELHKEWVNFQRQHDL